jgi:hypothetical protein
MLWVPKKGPLRIETNYGSAAVTAGFGTQVTTHATSASTKGNVAQLIAATAFDAYYVVVQAWGYGAAATTRKCCLDIMIGAATEEVLIPDLLAGAAGEFGATIGPGAKVWEFPLYIPAGSRLGARAAGTTVNNSELWVCISLYGGDGYPPWRVGEKVTTYGIGTVPAGKACPAGTGATDGNFDTQLVASTTYDHFAFVPSLQAPTDTTIITNYRNLNFGVGSAADPTNVKPIGGGNQGWCFKMDTNETMSGPYPSMPAYQDVPAGTELCARLSSNSSDDAAAWEIACHAVGP